MSRSRGGNARLAVLLVLFAAASRAHALDADQVFDKVSSSVVLVRAVRNNSQTIGSGVVVARERVVTTCHIASGRQELIVKWGEITLPATLEYSDAVRDLCLLLVPGLRAYAPSFATLQAARVGQRVYAIGNPEGLELTLSDGLVSALRTIRGLPYIQTSAPLASGSSGGGLFDSEGKLIGITTSGGKEGLGLNFAIPVEQVTANSVFARALVEPVEAPQAIAGTDGFPRLLLSRDILVHFAEFPQIDANLDHHNSFQLKVSFRRAADGRAERWCPRCRRKFDYATVTLAPSQDGVCFEWYRATYPDSGCFQLVQTHENEFALRPMHGKGEITYAVRR